MLNRRLLRIKAMQALYAFKQAEKSGYDVARDVIGESFEQLALIEGRDIIMPEKHTAKGVALFDEGFISGRIPADLDNPQARKAAIDALDSYRQQLAKDKDFIGRNMLLEAEKIYKNYLSVLALVVALSDQVKIEEEEKAAMHIVPEPLPDYMLKFYFNNPLAEALRNFKLFRNECAKYEIDWTTQNTFVRRLYRESLKNDERYQEYIRQRDEVSDADTEKMMRHIAKNVILKNESAKEFFEEENIAWAEDRDVIFSMAGKTLKSLLTPNPELSALSQDWYEDKQFFKDLYTFTLLHEKENEPLIAAKLQNWDMSRIASTDNIMLQMALTEMLHFSSIPVKATINEYLELAKIYSTPQSKQFINGVLDNLSEELTREGKIRKSGRGLIDNQ